MEQLDKGVKRVMGRGQMVHGDNGAVRDSLYEPLYYALLRSDKGEAEREFVRLMEGPEGVRKGETALVVALERIGRDWENGDAALSQVYMSGKICEELTARLHSDPLVGSASAPEECAIALFHDFHALGKRIVLSALRSAGFRVQDWGRKTRDELLVLTLASDIKVLLLSALMLPSALAIKSLSEGLRSKGFKGKIMVGGAPFRLDRQLWLEVGADATADNAMGAVSALSSLLGGTA